LLRNGAATGKDLADSKTEKLIAESEKNSASAEIATAETDLIAERSAILEHEINLKLAGFDPPTLLNAKYGNIWLICEVPESQLNKLKTGGNCTIKFSSFPDEKYTGRIEAFGDVVDNLTRTFKLRISLPNPSGQIKAGMFAVASFGVSEGELLSVPQNAIVTVQGKNYVFVRKNAREFERREISSGQQIKDRIIIFGGLKEGEKVVVKGTIQLKGLSFGY
jgi:membrane fusion protein, heavy metal efflux system